MQKKQLSIIVIILIVPREYLLLMLASNIHARHLYERLGFEQLGIIPSGFRMKDGHYEDICPYYHEL